MALLVMVLPLHLLRVVVIMCIVLTFGMRSYATSRSPQVATGDAGD